MSDINFIRTSLIKEIIHNPLLLVQDDINFVTKERNVRFCFKDEIDRYSIQIFYDKLNEKWVYNTYKNDKKLSDDETYMLFALINSKYKLNFT